MKNEVTTDSESERQPIPRITIVTREVYGDALRAGLVEGKDFRYDPPTPEERKASIEIVLSRTEQVTYTTNLRDRYSSMKRLLREGEFSTSEQLKMWEREATEVRHSLGSERPEHHTEYAEKIEKEIERLERDQNSPDNNEAGAFGAAASPKCRTPRAIDVVRDKLSSFSDEMNDYEIAKKLHEKYPAFKKDTLRTHVRDERKRNKKKPNSIPGFFLI